MKDHQIRELVNDIRDELLEKLRGYKLPQCLRTLIANAVNGSLDRQGLLLDKRDKEGCRLDGKR